MTRDDIIRMAREAHHELITQDYPGHLGQLDPWTLRLLERFANLVAEAEREACAGLCDEIEKKKWETVMHGGEMQGISARDCAAAIRDRGENK
jgi:hypothetical protein